MITLLYLLGMCGTFAIGVSLGRLIERHNRGER